MEEEEKTYEVHFPDLTGQRPHYVCKLPYRDQDFTHFMVNLLAMCTQPLPDVSGKTKPRRSARPDLDPPKKP